MVVSQLSIAQLQGTIFTLDSRQLVIPGVVQVYTSLWVHTEIQDLSFTSTQLVSIRSHAGNYLPVYDYI